MGGDGDPDVTRGDRAANTKLSPPLLLTSRRQRDNAASGTARHAGCEGAKGHDAPRQKQKKKWGPIHTHTLPSFFFNRMGGADALEIGACDRSVILVKVRRERVCVCVCARALCQWRSTSGGRNRCTCACVRACMCVLSILLAQQEWRLKEVCVCVCVRACVRVCSR